MLASGENGNKSFKVNFKRRIFFWGNIIFFSGEFSVYSKRSVIPSDKRMLQFSDGGPTVEKEKR